MEIRRVVNKGRSSWVVRWREDGHRYQQTLDSKEDAEALLNDARRRRQMGALAVAAPSPEPLGDLLARWFEQEAPAWAASTARVRSGVLTHWIYPYLKKVRLKDLGPAKVRQWRDTILRDGASNWQANHALSILSSFCGQLVVDGRIERNPCSGVRKLPTRMSRPRALLPIEVERIRMAMATPRDRLAVVLMAYAGLRPGEAFGLLWEAVTEHILIIDQSFTDGELKDTKTHSRRSIDISPILAEDIEPLRKSAGPVIVNRYGQMMDESNWEKRIWKPALKRVDIEAVPYDLRHTFASLLIHEGASLPLVAEKMGHSSLTTTLKHYAHVFDHAKHASRKSMGEAILEARAEVQRRRLRVVAAAG